MIEFIQALLRAITSNTLAEILLSVAILPVSSWAMFYVVVGIREKGRPWEVGLPGLGGASVLWGAVLFCLEPRLYDPSDWDVALIVLGVALIVLPRLIRTALDFGRAEMKRGH